MTPHTKEKLLAEIQPTHTIEMTIGLDRGFLLITIAEIQFIARRFSGWDVVEKYRRADFVKIHTVHNFMGTTISLIFQNGRLHCKDIADDVDLQLLLTNVESVRSEPAQEISSFSENISESVPDSTQEEQDLAQLLDQLLQGNTKTQTRSVTTERLPNSENAPRNRQKPKEPNSVHQPIASNNTQKKSRYTSETQKTVDILNIPEQPAEKKAAGCMTVFKYLFWFYIIMSVLKSLD